MIGKMRVAPVTVYRVDDEGEVTGYWKMVSATPTDVPGLCVTPEPKAIEDVAWDRGTARLIRRRPEPCARDRRHAPSAGQAPGGGLVSDATIEARALFSVAEALRSLAVEEGDHPSAAAIAGTATAADFVRDGTFVLGVPVPGDTDVRIHVVSVSCTSSKSRQIQMVNRCTL